MKGRKSIFMLLAMLGAFCTSIAQTAAPADFFAGKWEVTIFGTPQGDSKMIADLARTDGKLTGHLKNTADPEAEKIVITSVEEAADKITLGFSAQGYDVTLDLSKVDDDNLKGNLLNMFDATAKRVK
ncbi:hypothetical protein LZD49_29655 [Dyadobacter sp. CY261]|uniref:hypothetical protein n=1 Tax=Dyadobacter sp. CY261 TaxID=2907203 RepID=UPI001F392B96|nr:hypothetical protein [Dyadobacter sp. CY261]MCF0074688.1 hypothetical protein [Dyadobacter sp. CY261]